MATANSTPAPRWTPTRIRKATPHPKPKGAIAKEWEFRGGPDRLTDLDGRHLLAHIVRYADLLDVTTDGMSSAEWSCDCQPTRWLLVPMPPKLMQLLEWCGAEYADLEDGADDEHDGTHEEASLGSGDDDVDQTLWAAGSYNSEPDREEDAADADDDTIIEPNVVHPVHGYRPDGDAERMTVREWAATP